MSKEEINNRIEYVVVCVGEFADRYGLSVDEAYAYLRRFTGIEMLLKHYEIAHTLPMNEIINDLTILCNRKGGKVA